MTQNVFHESKGVKGAVGKILGEITVLLFFLAQKFSCGGNAPGHIQVDRAVVGQVALYLPSVNTCTIHAQAKQPWAWPPSVRLLAVESNNGHRFREAALASITPRARVLRH